MSRLPVSSRYLHPESSPSSSRTHELYDRPSSPEPPRGQQLGSPIHMSNRGSPAPARAGSDLSTTRNKQSKRDEALRRKIENDLIKRRPGSKRSGPSSRRERAQRQQHQAGTVSALRPLPALTVPQSISVADASQLCAAKRTDCVLVVDDEEHLCGIFTAKDLAFRVIGEGLDPRATAVAQIMTPNPMVTRDTTSATDALQTMVSRGFRHLPVCNEDGDVVGLLDITKVFHSSLEKLERAYSSSQQLYNAVQGVQSEWSSGANQALVSYVEQIRESMAAPEVASLLDARTAAVTVGVRTSVKDAARLMREHRTTAVIVLETPAHQLAPGESPRIAGIFTSKDVVLRVIAAGLDSRTCSVVRVMTPHPDTVTPGTTIQRALRKMHDGHYLNLPIVQEDGALVACVDVLKLTYATLEQISAIDNPEDGSGGDAAAGGPMWSRFFNSFAAGAPDALVGDVGGDGDTESIVSASDLPGTPSRHAHNQSMSEVHPGDSASAIDDDSVLHGLKSRGGAESSLAPVGGSEEGTYLFKFLAPGGATHRFQSRYAGEEVFEHVTDIVTGKLTSDPFFEEQGSDRDPHDFKLNYLDDDGDLVLISTSKDVEDAVKVARKQGKDRVVLQLRGGKGWESAMGAAKEAAQAKSLAAIAEDETEAGEKEAAGSQVSSRSRVSSKRSARASGVDGDEQLLFGVLPKDLAVPAAIAFLGVTIIGVFTASRLTAR